MLKKTNEQSQVGHLGSFDKTNITLSYLSDNSFGIYNSNNMVGRFSSERKRKTSFMLEPLIYWKTEVNVDFLRFSWVMRNNYKISNALVISVVVPLVNVLLAGNLSP